VVRLVFRRGKALHLVHGLHPASSPCRFGRRPRRAVLTRRWRPLPLVPRRRHHQTTRGTRSRPRRCGGSRRACRRSPQFAGAKDVASPQNALRTVAVLSDILAKAQALGETELEADPGFQGALRQVSTRFGASLGLDAVDLALPKLAENRATAGAVPELRRRLAVARRTLAGGGGR
jgi:hypothetical protein